MLAHWTGIHPDCPGRPGTETSDLRCPQAWSKKEDKKTVDNYISELRKLNAADGLQCTCDPVQAAETLLRLPKNGVKVTSNKELTALHRKYFVDYWSPTMVTLDAHLHMVTEVANHLEGLGRKIGGEPRKSEGARSVSSITNGKPLYECWSGTGTFLGVPGQDGCHRTKGAAQKMILPGYSVRSD